MLGGIGHALPFGFPLVGGEHDGSAGRGNKIEERELSGWKYSTSGRERQ